MILKRLLVASAAALALVAGSSFAATDDAIAERIKPYGNVCLVGDACATVAAAPAAAGADAGAAGASTAGRSGEAVYGQFCTVCHGTGLLGAPKTGDTAAWKAREDAVGGMDKLVLSAIAGKNAMPPKGTCGDCSNDEIHAAIEHMSGL